MDIKTAKISTFWKYFNVQRLTVVSKQYVLVFYSEISKLIFFKKFNNFALLNPLSCQKNGGGAKSSTLTEHYFQPMLYPSSLKPHTPCTLKSIFYYQFFTNSCIVIVKSSFKFQKLQYWTWGYAPSPNYTITQKYCKYQCKILLCVSVPNIKSIGLIFLREFLLLTSDSSIIFRNS